MMLTAQQITDAEARRWQQRYEHVLVQVPVLLETLRELAIPLAATQLDRPRVSGATRSIPMPFRVDPIDACDDLWAALIEYVREVAEHLHEPTPEAAGWTWAAPNGPRGIPAWMTPDDAYKAGWHIVAWLVDRAPRTHPLGLVASETFLLDTIRTACRRWVDAPPIERPAHRRTCTLCGEKTVTVAWLYGDTGEAACRACGAVYAPVGES